MLARLIDARHIRDYTLWVRFADGCEGEVDLWGELDGEVFEALKDKDFFARMKLDPELRTVPQSFCARLCVSPPERRLT
jgi:hypothetical protein